MNAFNDFEGSLPEDSSRRLGAGELAYGVIMNAYAESVPHVAQQVIAFAVVATLAVDGIRRILDS